MVNEGAERVGPAVSMATGSPQLEDVIGRWERCGIEEGQHRSSQRLHNSEHKQWY